MIPRRIAAPALACAVVLALAGCTPPAAEPTPWQGVVQTLAAQASGGDYASASATLDQLEADVIAQRDAGTLPSAEAEAILARIAVVRADLTTLTPAPEPTTVETTAPVTDDTPESDDDEPEPTQSTVDDDGEDDEQPQAPADPGGKGAENPGKGNGGKGKSDQPTTPGGPGKKDG